MLTQAFIKLLPTPCRCKHIASVVCLSLYLTACTSTPEVEEQITDTNEQDKVTQAEEKTAPDAAEGLVKAESEKKELEAKPSRVPAINLYVEQQKNNPIVIPDDIIQDYQTALSLMKEKKWQQADLLLDQVILKQPQLSGSYVNKAIIAKEQGDLEQAQVLLDTAISTNGLNLYAHHLQGQVYRLQGEFDKAEQSYINAIAIWPDFGEAYVSMAVLLELYRGRLIDAHGYYSQYLALHSDDEEVKRWLAGLEIKIKRAGLIIPEAIPESIPESKPGIEESEPQDIDSQNTAPQNSEQPASNDQALDKAAQEKNNA